MVFACWQVAERNPWFFAPAIASFLEDPPAPAEGRSPTGPFVFGDPARTAAILRSAGFEGVESKPHDITVDVPPDSIVDEAQLAFMGIPADRLLAAGAAVEAYMRQFVVSPTVLRVPLAFQIVRATTA
jgi:hypothetical protein